ncbi:levanase/fructan beta-fructosidase [Flavobacteriaceae bacterium MAR_2009_75]|nr:levanase/fructan beta-fructosidase [Flavobacteriaceae bacterium MAR_2009_75]
MSSLKNITSLILILIAVLNCKENPEKNTDEMNTDKVNVASSEESLYRPNFHFTPKKNWMNDPNGMFYYNNYYHLYFQHYPDDNVWGPMHWGHATSTDMVTWKEQPIALYPDELGYIFSGSAVVDIDNTSGFGKDGKVPIVAMFTYHDPKKAEAKKTDVESQGIAFSLDEGLTWTKYEDNPVIKNAGDRDFRDPKVMWDTERRQWVMVLAAGQKTIFYSSTNLKDWKRLSAFGEGIGNHNGVWECPDLFPLTVQGTNEQKWVLLVSINPGGPNGGSATQYFIGDFDGTQFSIDPEFEKAINNNHDFWVDLGKDNYAGVTWSNIETSDGAKLFMGWMSNWQYANQVPTESWRSAMTVAREMRLVKEGGTHRLAFVPTEKIKGYRGKKFKESEIVVKEDTKIIDSENVDLSSAEIIFNVSELNSDLNFTLSNSQGDELSFGYTIADKSFYIDRSNSGKTDFSKDFANKKSTAVRISDSSNLSGRILLDKTSIEMFFDNGLNVITEVFFPNSPFEKLILDSEKETTLDHLEIHELIIN